MHPSTTKSALKPDGDGDELEDDPTNNNALRVMQLEREVKHMEATDVIMRKKITSLEKEKLALKDNIQKATDDCRETLEEVKSGRNVIKRLKQDLKIASRETQLFEKRAQSKAIQ